MVKLAFHSTALREYYALMLLISHLQNNPKNSQQIHFIIFTQYSGIITILSMAFFDMTVDCCGCGASVKSTVDSKEELSTADMSSLSFSRIWKDQHFASSSRNDYQLDIQVPTNSVVE
jgi:hypothetical protein